MGEGFSLRWCFKHDVTIGSRDGQRAKVAAQGYSEVARKAYGTSMVGSVAGDDNIELGRNADILILCIPYETINDTCSKLVGQIRADCVVVSPIVPMNRTDAGFGYIPIEQGKEPAAELVAKRMSPRSRIVSAFHTISEVKLKDIKLSLDADIFVCGDDSNNVAIVNNLVSEINGLRPIFLGPLALTYQAEVLTPMLLNAAKRNKIRNPALRIVH